MLLSGRDGVYTGSARSVGEFHLYQCLLACDSLLLRYGGHRQAAGFTIGEENLEAFFRQVEEYAAGQPLAQPELWLDGVLSPQDLTVEQIEKLSALEPFGEANPVPVFLLPKVKAAAVESIGEGKHTRYRMDWMGTRFTAVQFRITPQQSFVQPGQELDLAAQISLREFRGRQYLSVQVLELRPSGLKQTLLLNGWNYYFRFFCGEELPSGVAQKAVPTRQQAVLVYRLLPKETQLFSGTVILFFIRQDQLFLLSHMPGHDGRSPADPSGAGRRVSASAGRRKGRPDANAFRTAAKKDGKGGYRK